MSDEMQQGMNTEQDDLLSLVLGIGDALQLQDVAELKKRYHADLIGFLNNKGVLVTHPEKDGELLQVREGQIFVVRGFADRKIYEFRADIIGVATHPYPHLHLAFPTQVGVIKLRGALRIRPRLSCTAEASDSALKTPAIIEDISTSGALIRAMSGLGEKGDTIQVGFRLPVGGDGIALTLPAIIRNLQRDDAGADGGKAILCGVQFVQPESRARMALQTYIYRTMSEG